jgi:uncharacterized protein involved in exopolysaccharide biosynthesis
MEAQRDALAKEAGDLRDRLARAAAQAASPQTGRSSNAASAAAQAAEAEIRGLEQREADVQDAIRKIRVDLADRRLAVLKLDALRREAAIDKELLEGALVRLKEQGPRSSSAGPGVEILARPDPALRPSFPNALLFLVGTLVAAVAAGIVMVWNPRSGGIRRSPNGR